MQLNNQPDKLLIIINKKNPTNKFQEKPAYNKFLINMNLNIIFHKIILIIIKSNLITIINF